MEQFHYSVLLSQWVGLVGRCRHTDRTSLVQWSGTSCCCSARRPAASREDWHEPWSCVDSTASAAAHQTSAPGWTSGRRELAWCMSSFVHVGNSCVLERRETEPRTSVIQATHIHRESIYWSDVRQSLGHRSYKQHTYTESQYIGATWHRA